MNASIARVARFDYQRAEGGDLARLLRYVVLASSVVLSTDPHPSTLRYVDVAHGHDPLLRLAVGAMWAYFASLASWGARR